MLRAQHKLGWGEISVPPFDSKEDWLNLWKFMAKEHLWTLWDNLVKVMSKGGKEGGREGCSLTSKVTARVVREMYEMSREATAETLVDTLV